MSKIKAALVTMFVLATSSAAMAATNYSNARWSSAPAQVVRTPIRWTAPRPQVRDHRLDETNVDYAKPQRGYEQSWMLLGTVDQVIQGAWAPMQFSVGRNQSISKIMLQSNGGKSRIEDVRINFANGSSKTITLDRYVGLQGSVDIPASQSYTIDLDTTCGFNAGRVTSITVDGINAINSSFSVYAA